MRLTGKLGLLALLSAPFVSIAAGAVLPDGGVESEAVLSTRFPPGTDIGPAQEYLQSSGFKCEPGAGPYLDRNKIERTGKYVYCDQERGAGDVGKRWQIILVKDATRIQTIHVVYSTRSLKSGPHPSSTDSGRPGQFRLLESNDDQTCRAVSMILETIRSKSGELDTSRLPGRAHWQRSDPPVTDPPSVFADFDIDNDGYPDRVLRVAWSLSSQYTDALFIQRDADLHSPPPSTPDAVRQFLRNSASIEFNSYADLIKRLQAEYGPHWEHWWMSGHVQIETLRLLDHTYVLAWNYLALPKGFARAYVFEVGKDGLRKDVCMFGRICTCNGCRGHESVTERRLRPDNRYCRPS
jgi:hypothetical protein